MKLFEFFEIKMGVSSLMTETKSKICNAIIDLLNTKKLDDISIKEIYITAKISHSAFYRNFKTKDEILIYYFLERKAQYYCDYNEVNNFNINFKKTYKYLSFIYYNREFVKKMYLNDKMNIIFHDLPKNINEIFQFINSQYYISTITHAFYGLIEEWVRQDFSITPKELILEMYNVNSKLNEILSQFVDLQKSQN